MSQGVNDKQFRSCYSISNHKTGWYPTHEVLPAVPLLPQRVVAGIIQGAKGELGSQWVKNVQVIQSLIIYQSRFNIHRSNYPRRWAEVRTGQQLILRVTHFSVSVENRDISTAAHFVPIHFADSAQTEYCTTFPSHISHKYKGINATLIIRGPIKPYIIWIKIILAIFLAKTRPDMTISSALTNMTIDYDFELSKI